MGNTVLPAGYVILVPLGCIRTLIPRTINSILELVAKLMGESEGKEDEVRSCLGEEEMAAAGEGVMLAIAEQLSCPGDAMEGL
jgi:hypothetical protein